MYVRELFEKFHGRSFGRVFGGCSDKGLLMKLRECVVPPISYGEEGVYESVYKADVSNAYPYEGTKSLPTMYGHQVLKGKVKPSKEFPFAFYLTSASLSIWGEFDTDDIVKLSKRFYRDALYRNEKRCAYIEDEEEVTILCKAAKLNLKTVFEWMYKMRKQDDLMKPRMVSAIGNWYNKTAPQFPCLSAVILSRCVYRMLKTAKEIEDRGNRVRIIATDAIGWTGKAEEDIYTRIKALGNFVLEHENVELMVKGAKCYQIKKGDKVLTVWSGMPKHLTKDMEFGEIYTFKRPPVEVIWDRNLLRFTNKNTKEIL
jgi:hypothetical protein